MRDGPLRRLVKALVRGMWTAEMALRRGLAKPRWEVAGSCQGCGACCEMPSISVGRALWYLPLSRRVFLWWQRVVNGFELIEADRESRTFSFRCSHFDWETRRCDAYDSRPFMCRDYPRVQMDNAWPQLFDGCGFRPRAVDGDGLRAEIEATDLGEDAKAALRKRLYLD